MEGCTLSKIKSISWKVSGDDKFKPEKTTVVLEDIEGKTWELVLHPQPYLKKWNDEVILNTVFSYHKIQMSGLWIGWNCDISEMVNTLRKTYPHTETFFVNEAECRKYDHVTPVHRF